MTGTDAPHFNNPQHWHERAEEARVHAEDMRDDLAKTMMLQIARDYDKLAMRALERIAAAAKAVVR